ncbi:AraC family transcriptional regulator [Flavobacterium azooxidireducens]|uniref:AraC family transcriptional regulator n=1 Tax=Flavobacterium azooxidireducens TaxID=1871076 RepID=A0ABY4KGZ9_9FLAO|nr:AraC family transcriptional regulator [Flavobacterium azooxidireducens]UPQ79814.1 AraC family transcriptional regulator [Flavobacterium azooxidireducens]
MKAKELLGNNPDETIKVGQHLVSLEDNHSKISAVKRLVSEAFLVKGDYHNALVYAFEAGYDFERLVIEDKIEVLLLKSSILYDLSLDAQGSTYLKQAGDFIAMIDDFSTKENFENKLILHKIMVLIRKQNFDKSIVLFKETNEFLNENADLKQEFDVVKGVVYFNLRQLDSAQIYFNKALDFSSKRKTENFFEKSVVLAEKSKVFFVEKNHQQAISLLNESLILANKINNVPLFRMVNKQLSVNYLVLNDKSNYQRYNNEFLILDGKLEQMEEESINSAFNLISEEYDLNFVAEENKAKNKLYIFLVGTVLLLVISIAFYLKNSWKRKRLNEIIKYLEISKNLFHKPATIEVKPSDKRMFIPIETEQLLLVKLKRFEQSTRFTSNDISLATLASQFDTNTKYLSEIINKHYEDNFNTYINKLRINYIIEKLKSDPNYIHYKISYLAEKCGFSSHSSFATVFKTITGITPATFIELLKEDLEKEKDEEVLDEV